MASLSQPEMFNSEPYLSPGQRELLLAALVSNNPAMRDAGNAYANPNHMNYPNTSSTNTLGQAPRGATISSDPHLGGSRNQEDGSGVSPFEELGFDDGSFGDLGLNFEFDGTFDDGLGEETNGQIARSALENEGETHDKRKTIDGDSPAADDGGGKRREGDDKTAKKPGRKPLTSEPTTKRKAQNRAAQRAFRERKEKHLKDLEVKVADLEKASESANHENGLLRAQVSRLQAELKDYRKRLSTGSRSITQSPPFGTRLPSYSSQNGNASARDNSFQFDFPRFGNLPGSLTNSVGFTGQHGQEHNKSSTEVDSTALYNVPGVLGRQPSSGKPSPSREEAMANQNGSPATTNGQAKFENSIGLFSPSLGSASQTASPDYFAARDGSVQRVQPPRKTSDCSVGPKQTSQLANAGYSASTSPSASSMSHHGQNSSTCTSPDSYNNNSPMNPKGLDTPLNTIHEELATPPAPTNGINLSHSNLAPAQASKPVTVDVNGIDWLAQQNGGQFDPVLFGDYREPQDALAAGEYGYFNDVFPLFDFSGALNDVPTPASAPKHNLMQEVESNQNAEVEPPAPCPFGEKFSEKLMDKIQKTDSYKTGDNIIEELCADMKKKAVCSEIQKMIDRGDEDALLNHFRKQGKHVDEDAMLDHFLKAGKHGF